MIKYLLIGLPIIFSSAYCSEVSNISERAVIDYHAFRVTEKELLYPKSLNTKSTVTVQEVNNHKYSYLIDRQILRARTLKEEPYIDFTVHFHSTPYFDLSPKVAKREIRRDKVGDYVLTDLNKEVRRER